MRRSLVLGVTALLVLSSACDQKPPSPKVEWSPDDREVLAGETIEIRAAKPLAYEKDAFEFRWTLSGDCAGELADPTAWKVNYDVPADCGGGEITLALQSTHRLGTTSESVTFKVKPQPKEEIGLTPVRPDPIPASWSFVNDYDGTIVEKDQDRRNKRDGYFGTWTYRDGKCGLTAAEDAGAGVLELKFLLPHSDLSACGYFEYFEGSPGDAKKADISEFGKVGFIAKSATGAPLTVRLELVEFDKFANYNQGIVSESEPLKIDGEWRRHEVDLRKLAKTWDIASAKSVGFRVDAKDKNPGQGVLLVDNLVLVRR